MGQDKWIIYDGKKLRCGYTTGSCATGAATTSFRVLLGEKITDSAEFFLPTGEVAYIPIKKIERIGSSVKVSVIKDGGDDPDVTTGMEICATCTLQSNGISILGGEGIGVVRNKGLPCEVGTSAINPSTQKMIRENIQKIADESGYDGGIEITISAPEGLKIAQKTFNSRLGIEGGISILGTTGVVEPMSEKALLDTIRLLIDQKLNQNSRAILISPGNYGQQYCRDHLGLDLDKGIKISNFLGESLDYLRYKKCPRILLVGHVGKLVKVALGIMNTHSKIADGRVEAFITQLALSGGTQEQFEQIFHSKTTDEIIGYLNEWGKTEEIMAKILDRILFYLNYRLRNEIQIEVILFDGQGNCLIKSSQVQKIIEELRKGGF